MSRARHTLLLALSALPLFLLPSFATAAARPDFAPAPAAQLTTDRMFEVVVADPNRDGYQDLLTTNHKFRSVFLQNSAGRSFFDNTVAVGYNPEPAFPGIEWLRAPSNMSRPGLYVYPTDSTGETGQVHLVSVGTRVNGRATFMTKSLAVPTRWDADVSVQFTPDARPFADFTIRPGGRITLATSSLSDLPVKFRTDLAASKVFVGAGAVSPKDASDFTFKLRDRHGIAFADFAGGQAQDLFISTGGLGGGIANPHYTGLVQDEVLVQSADTPGKYGNTQAKSGMDKGTCRGRGAEWVDFNKDGRLDLFQECEEQRPQMWRQTQRGKFERVPDLPVVGSAYRWMQLDGGRPVVLASRPTQMQILQWNGGSWVQQQRPLSAGGGSLQIGLGDYDSNGATDVLSVDSQKLTLFRNKQGSLTQVANKDLGLPQQAEAASFVDYDNDGWQDLYLFPHGLYRFNPISRRYEATGALAMPPEAYATAQWMDYNNDGRRDPVISYSNRQFSQASQIARRQNTTAGGNWLEVDLEGPLGNREAIGAKVTVSLAQPKRGDRSRRARASAPAQITQWVGQNDDAPHSQGHYRLYFGLGTQARVQSLEIRWPDGSRTTRGVIAANQLLRFVQR